MTNHLLYAIAALSLTFGSFMALTHFVKKFKELQLPKTEAVTRLDRKICAGVTITGSFFVLISGQLAFQAEHLIFLLFSVITITTMVVLHRHIFSTAYAESSRRHEESCSKAST